MWGIHWVFFLNIYTFLRVSNILLSPLPHLDTLSAAFRQAGSEENHEKKIL
jgi:hypothetical protein